MKKLGLLMIVMGIVIIAIPITGNYYNQYKQEKMYEAYVAVQQGDAYKTMNQTFQGIRDEQVRIPRIVVDEYVTNNSLILPQKAFEVAVIGIVKIPKIELQTLLVEGVTDKALKHAVGHMPGTALPGDVGNCSIAGHRSYTFGEYFNRLNEVEVDDIIEVVHGDEIYTYKVYETLIVEPSQIEVIQSQGDRQVVTLITCHPVVVATHRLIVRGELVSTTKVADEMVNRYNSNQ